jgi:outer membrane protein
MSSKLITTSLLFTSVIFFLATSISLAQNSIVTRPRLEPDQSYSFDDLLELGLEYNFNLRSNQLDVEGLRWDRMAAIGTLLPTISSNASFTANEYHTFSFLDFSSTVGFYPEEIVSRSVRSSASISLNQDLFKGFANIAGFRKAKLMMQDVLAVDISGHMQFVHDLRKAVHRVLVAKASLESANALLAESAEQNRLARTRYEIGAVIQLDVLQTEINLGQQQINVEGLEQDLRSAWDVLTLLLGVEPSTPGNLSTDFYAFEPQWTDEELLVMARENRQDLRSSVREKDKSKQDLIISRSAYMPTVSATVGHSRWTSRAIKEFKVYPDNYQSYAGVSISLPLFQGFNTLNSYQRAKSELKRQKLRDEQLDLQVQSEVRDANARLQSSFKQSKLAEKNRELARQSLDLERERYRLGLASLLNVQSAESVFQQAESEHLSQLLAFHDRLAELELAVGLTLE